ncbi:MAG TPA: hypothetical protein VEJ18_16215, partial [Planctomycetota bacterium]|nr:hypothetical protein [Planctomycetota bacterium]
MRTFTPLLALALSTAVAHAQGLVVPTDPEIPPLALLRHAVKVDVEQQAAVTTVEQVFQNNTDRP